MCGGVEEALYGIRMMVHVHIGSRIYFISFSCHAFSSSSLSGLGVEDSGQGNLGV